MDSGWAVVIGAVVAFAGTVLGPWLLDASKRKTEAETSRRAELGVLIPKLFESVDRSTNPPTGETEMVVRLQLLLGANESPIGNILLIAATHRSDSRVQSAARTSVTMWFRGQASIEKASEMFEQATARIVRAPQ
jgi:hypothetical protein